MAFRVALVQFDPDRKNVNGNIQKIETLLKDVRADMIVLPELSNSGYLYKNTASLKEIAEHNDGSGIFLSALRELAIKSNGVIISGYAEIDKSMVFNSAAAISPDGVLNNYRKTHLYDTEKKLFTPGDSGFKVFEWQRVNIGIMICFDWIFPESARTLALTGAQIIAHPANLVMPYCQNAMVTRSLENKVFTVTANRHGKEKLNNTKLRFTGTSQITAPNGSILYRGPKNKSTVHVMTIEPQEALDKNISSSNDLFQDRRPNFYLSSQ